MFTMEIEGASSWFKVATYDTMEEAEGDLDILEALNEIDGFRMEYRIRELNKAIAA